MSVKVFSKVLGLNNFIEKIQSSKKTLNVGFLNSKNAIIAAKNEYGGTFATDNVYKKRGAEKGITVPDKITIPPRPFMQNTATKQKGKWAKLLVETSKQNGLDIENSLNIVGLQAKADIRETIEEGDFTPNSDKTIAIKGKDTPLIDTGEMANSIDSEVV
jgi:hypothetical protein